MLGLISLALGTAAGGVGFIKTRDFVKRRLRFVEIAHKPAAPLVAGAATALVVTALPIVGIGGGIAAGIGVGMGVARGSQQSRRS